MSFIEGFLTGLAMIIFIGPVLFTLIQASLGHGFKGGMAVALGIIIGDLIVVAICLMGANVILLSEKNEVWIAIIGALILGFMAVRYLTKPQFFAKEPAKLGALGFSGLFSKGFLVNFVNPFVFVVWLGLIGYGQEKYTGSVELYLFGVLLGIFLTDSLKAFFASKLKRFLSDERLGTIYKGIALLFIVFALRLIYFAIKNY